MNAIISISTVLKDKLSDKLSIFYNDEKDIVERLYPDKDSHTLENIFYSEPSHIIDNIYLGNAINACNIDTINLYNFKSIINVTEEIPNYFMDNSINYLKIHIRDNQNATIKPYINDFIKFIDNNENNNILIHCYMGVSRSTSLVLYYLIKKKKYNLENALTFVNDKRKYINLNILLYNELKSII